MRKTALVVAAAATLALLFLIPKRRPRTEVSVHQYLLEHPQITEMQWELSEKVWRK